MATPQNSGNTPARTNTPSTQDSALDAAVQTAGERPELAAELAQDLGLSFADRKQYSESALHMALRGHGFPPPVFDDYWDRPPAGSFDAGIARVMGEQYVEDFTEWVRGRGLRIDTSHLERTAAVAREVRASYGFARFATSLVSGILLAKEEGDTLEERQSSAEGDISQMAATSFLAGWYMGQEFRELRLAERSRGVKGTTEELVDIFQRKIDMNVLDDVTLSFGGTLADEQPYWTPEQIATARAIVRKEEMAREGSGQ